MPGGVHLEHPLVMRGVGAGRVRRIGVLREDRGLRHARLDDRDADAERARLPARAARSAPRTPTSTPRTELGDGADATRDRRDVDDRARLPLAHPGQHPRTQRSPPQTSTSSPRASAPAWTPRPRRCRRLPALFTRWSTRPHAIEDRREAGAHRLVVGDVELDQLDLDARGRRGCVQLVCLGQRPHRAEHRVARLRRGGRRLPARSPSWHRSRRKLGARVSRRRTRKQT